MAYPITGVRKRTVYVHFRTPVYSFLGDFIGIVIAASKLK